MKNLASYILTFLIIILTTNCAVKSNDVEFDKDTTPPKIQFETKTHDFGTLEHGQVVECNFKFENIGGKPLKIISVEPDCGCTIPKFDKKEIIKGEKGKINITFDTYGFRNNQLKTIKVKTNDNKITTLVIAAFIKNE